MLSPPPSGDLIQQEAYHSLYAASKSLADGKKGER